MTLTPTRLHAFRQIIDSLRPSPLADELEGIYAEVAADVVTPYYIGELAKRIDIAPADVLAAVVKLGLFPVWVEGTQYRTASLLRTLLIQEHPWDPAPDVELYVTPAQIAALAAELQVTPGELLAEGVEA